MIFTYISINLVLIFLLIIDYAIYNYIKPKYHFIFFAYEFETMFLDWLGSLIGVKRCASAEGFRPAKNIGKFFRTVIKS